MPSRPSAIFAARLAGGRNRSPLRTSDVAGSVRPLSRRNVACGASAALAKRSITSPAVVGLGSVRWKACPSRPGSWAMWSIASATKSTGTMLISPPSTPIVGSHDGSTRRARCSSLKK